MVKTLNCYLYAKKVMALCLRVQFFLANPVALIFIKTALKLSYFCQKNKKNFRGLGAPLQTPVTAFPIADFWLRA